MPKNLNPREAERLAALERFKRSIKRWPAPLAKYGSAATSFQTGVSVEGVARPEGYMPENKSAASTPSGINLAS
jgi:hypothetical protein